MDRKSYRKSKFLKIIIVSLVIVGLIIVTIPVYLFASVIITCNNRENELNKLTDSVKSKLTNIVNERNDITIDVYKNGDCLTGSGTHYVIKSDKSYSNYKFAENDLNMLLASQELAVPTTSEELFGVNQGAGITDYSNIQNIGYTKKLANDIYTYTYSLKNKIYCDYSAQTLQDTCDGIPKTEAETMQFMSDRPVSSAEISGSVLLDID